jgi:hypothetical protein
LIVWAKLGDILIGCVFYHLVNWVFNCGWNGYICFVNHLTILKQTIMTQEFSKTIIEESQSELLVKIPIEQGGFDQPFISDDTIIELLNQKVDIEKKIEKQLQEKGFKHFSSKKFVGDLGEYYALINLKHLFEEGTFEISTTSNSPCDIKGKLKSEVAKKWDINQDVRIEVKTRYYQKGNSHIFGIKKENFDLLVYVSLNEDYTVHFIGVLINNDLLKVDAQKRIVFSEDLKLVYPVNIKFEVHK